MLYPGHHYLGPGNPLENGKPVNRADEIAQEHDWRYQLAITKEDVRAADRKAINEFFKDGFSEPHAWVGALGLGAKYIGESVFGVQYPRKNFAVQSKVRRGSLVGHKQLQLNSNIRKQLQPIGVTKPYPSKGRLITYNRTTPDLKDQTI